MKISCIIPTYNYGHLLEEAVQSIFNQSYKAHEIIILDDDSKDNTSEIAKDLQGKCSYLRYVKNKKNIGLVSNFNKGVLLATGDYICILGADDVLHQDYFHKVYDVINEDSSFSIVYSDFLLFGDNAENIYNEYDSRLKIDNKKYLISFPDFNDSKFTEMFNSGINLINTSSIYKKELFSKIGGYRDLYVAGIPEDYDFFKRSIELGYKAFHISEPLLNYRQHSKKQNNRILSLVAERLFYKDKYKELLLENKVLKNKVSEYEDCLQDASEFISRKESEIVELKTKVNQKAEIS